MNQFPPPPPAPGTPYMPQGPAENPEGTKALIVAILGLLCCGPLAIWSFIMSNEARGAGYTDTKTTLAFVISIAALVLWVLGFIWQIVFAASL